MYNLLMTAGNQTWDGTPYTFGAGRVFEYTSDFLSARFGELERPEVDELLSLPCLFAYERHEDTDAHIGSITNLRKRGGEVRIEYAFDPNLPSVPAQRFSELGWELDIADWEFNRVHWAVKDVDIFHELINADVFTSQQVAASPIGRRVGYDSAGVGLESTEAQPTVFRVPQGGIEADLVSVMRPFRQEFDHVYEVLRQVCEELGLRCMDSNEVWNENEVIQDIFSLIFRSRVVICDYSNRNSNVFYEAGISHTLGRTVIPIVQNAEHIPFDLRHHRYIEYLNNAEGLVELKVKITPRLRTLFAI